MPSSRNPSAYPDVISVLETIARHGVFPAELSFNSAHEAKHWRHRANAYRAALRTLEEHTQGLAPGTGTCIYDTWKFALEGTVVTIDRAAAKAKLEIAGKAVEPLSDLDAGISGDDDDWT